MNKKEIVTFKVDKDLHETIKKIPNRSEFIRRAITAALESTCPLCRGSGKLNEDQKRHWDSFTADHFFKKCDTCNEHILICGNNR
jgi:metal-responsive CopG/Arc/MetJ family transcriptional regulator